MDKRQEVKKTWQKQPVSVCVYFGVECWHADNMTSSDVYWVLKSIILFFSNSVKSSQCISVQM